MKDKKNNLKNKLSKLTKIFKYNLDINSMIIKVALLQFQGDIKVYQVNILLQDFSSI